MMRREGTAYFRYGDKGIPEPCFSTDLRQAVSLVEVGLEVTERRKQQEQRA